MICHLSVVLLQLSCSVVHSFPKRCEILDFRRRKTKPTIKEYVKPAGWCSHQSFIPPLLSCPSCLSPTTIWLQIFLDRWSKKFWTYFVCSVCKIKQKYQNLFCLALAASAHPLSDCKYFQIGGYEELPLWRFKPLNRINNFMSRKTTFYFLYPISYFKLRMYPNMNTTININMKYKCAKICLTSSISDAVSITLLSSLISSITLSCYQSIILGKSAMQYQFICTIERIHI